MDARVPRAAETTVTDVRTAGPFYERVETSAGDVRVSFRPLLHTRIEVPQDHARIREVLWPLYADRQRKEHFSWRFLLAFGWDFDTDRNDSRYAVWLLPFWFQGRTDTKDDYAALFPLGGVLHDFLGYDRLRFVAFPLWGETRKKDVTGRHVLWPVFARVKGDGLFRWRVFPLAGYGRQEGRWERHSILWPIWNHVRYDEEPAAGTEWSLTPLFGRAERGVESSWYLLPPFFQFTFGRGPNAGQRRMLLPWPLVRIEDSRNRHKRHYWPLYATSWTDRHRRTHVLWPFFQYDTTRSGRNVQTRWSLAPLFHRSVHRQLPLLKDGGDAAPPEAELRGSYTRLWPLFSSVQQGGHGFVRVPDFSLQRRVGALERSLLQMGTLYTRGEDRGPGRVEHDLLWGFLRWGRDEQGCREARLWPLVSWRREEGGGSRATWSLLGGLLRFPLSSGAGVESSPRESP